VSGHLPIDPYLPAIVDAVRRQRAVVVTAAPGAGKTTRVPPALVPDGPVILLQPRRLAARAIAARIAAEQSWTLGREVGWQIRFERKFTGNTRLLVVTEGILTARLQSDPLLSGFKTVVLDEFHERGIHGDLAIALGRQAWRARDDLRIVVMSATIDAAKVSAFLGGCPVVEVPGRTHPVDIHYAPGQSVADAACEALGATRGQVLCFLPGAMEIRRAMADIMPRAGDGVEVLPLYGSLSADEQDRALETGTRRRVIVATNIAETSLTVPGVTAVVDVGLQKVARYDADRGIDSLETERITADAADQRAGRAGRVAPGIVRRLWDARDRLRPHREPDIVRIDLSATALDVIAWGGDPRTLEWFEAPSPRALDAALTLLARLGLVAGGRLTHDGEQVRRLPLHPRLARMLLAARGSREAVRACALLSERHLLPLRAATTSSDLLSAMDDWDSVPAHVQRAAAQIARTVDSLQSEIRHVDSAMPCGEPGFLRAILAGYPDRVAQRREPRSPDVLLSSGAGAALGRESGVRDGEFLVALDVSSAAGSARRVGFSNPHAGRSLQPPIIRIASRVEREWLAPTSSDIVHRLDGASGRVKASQVDRYDALVLTERPVAVDPEIAARLLADAWIGRGPRGEDARLLARLRFAGRDFDLASLVGDAARSARALDEIRIGRALPSALGRNLDRDAPDTLAVPSGRSVALEYHDDGSVSASVKLQELFGLAETPRIGTKGVPVRFALLAPNGRPVQVTQDLGGFWERTYPQVRRELRGRYPKHPWPEDPWSATPTARVKRRT
jgi:ATP-dependent helicase HrpB